MSEGSVSSYGGHNSKRRSVRQKMKSQRRNVVAEGEHGTQVDEATTRTKLLMSAPTECEPADGRRGVARRGVRGVPYFGKVPLSEKKEQRFFCDRGTRGVIDMKTGKRAVGGAMKECFWGWRAPGIVDRGEGAGTN